MARVYVKIPKTGLGNMMLVWAHGMVFARKNNLQVISSKWWGFRWGALIRREKKNRLYLGYFREEPMLNRIKVSILLLFRKPIYNPDLNVPFEKVNKKTVFIFNKLPPRHYFNNLYPYRQFLTEKLLGTLSTNALAEFRKCKAPEIGVHIRRGDFKVANFITPVSYFVNLIKIIRSIYGEALSVTLFTDAEEDEIRDILRLENVELAKNKFDITDILQLSKSNFLLLSKDSSFSYWASFLSHGITIMHHQDWHQYIKPDSTGILEFRYSAENDNDLKNFLIGRKEYFKDLHN